MSLKTIRHSGSLLIVYAAILWALDGIIRRSLFVLPPVTIVFFEHLIGSLLLLPFTWRALTQIKITKRVLLLTVTISLLSGLLGTLWFTTALLKVNFIAFSVVFLIQKLQPIFTVLSARIFLKEKISAAYALWAGVALLAAYFVTFPSGRVNLGTGAGTIIAALFALGAAAAWGSSTALSKLLIKDVGATAATSMRFVTTTLISFLAVLLMGKLSTFALVGQTELLRFFVIALSTGMIGLWIYYKGLTTVRASVSTILELVFPLLAIVIDAVMYKTFLLPEQMLAAAVLLFAMYRVTAVARE